MTKNILTVLLVSLAVSMPLLGNDNALGREFYDSLVQCSAFHSVEASFSSEGTDVAASQLAAAADYRADARKHSPDGKPETADADIDRLAQSYRKTLSEGDPEVMAKGWTALESACRELHIAKGRLAAQTGSDNFR
jgi:hypothetical protein